MLWFRESKGNFHIFPSQGLPQHRCDWLSSACPLMHRRLHSVGASDSAVEQKSWDGPWMELEAIKQVFTVISIHTAGTWRTFFDFRLMTDCRLMGAQVNWLKFNIKYGQGSPQGLWKQSGLLTYKAGCLKPKGTQTLTVRTVFYFVLDKFCSRHFDMVCMTGGTAGHTSPTSLSGPYKVNFSQTQHQQMSPEAKVLIQLRSNFWPINCTLKQAFKH